MTISALSVKRPWIGSPIYDAKALYSHAKAYIKTNLITACLDHARHCPDDGRFEEQVPLLHRFDCALVDTDRSVLLQYLDTTNRDGRDDCWCARQRQRISTPSSVTDIGSPRTSSGR